jgi:hypothetical protein
MRFPAKSGHSTGASSRCIYRVSKIGNALGELRKDVSTIVLIAFMQNKKVLQLYPIVLSHNAYQAAPY